MKVMIVLVAIITFSIIYSLFFSLTSPEFFGLVKPITVIQYSGFILFALMLNKLYEKYAGWFEENRTLAITMAFFLLMATAYEALWTFHYWFSVFNFYSLDADIDEIVFHPIEGRVSYPYNMNVNSKLFWLYSFCLIYFIVKVGVFKDGKKEVKT